MRIISQPTEPIKPKTTTVTCRRCKAVLEVKKSDCKLVGDQREGDYYNFACPCCRCRDNIDARRW